jgi:CubicO group peptidase (beta-lactamase class C family)
MLRHLVTGLSLLLAPTAVSAAPSPLATANMAKLVGKPVTQVDHLTPAETVSGCGAAALPVAQTGILAPGTFEAMRQWSDANGGVGLIVLVNGKLAGQAYAPGITGATPIQTNSMHKSVVALLMGAAMADGLVKSVDDPVRRYIPEWTNDPRGKITLRQLLSMASGLKNPALAKGDQTAIELMMGNVSAAAMSLPGAGSAGTFNYNNADYQLVGTALAKAIERGGKGRYAEYLSRRLWCPLGNGPASLWLEFDGGQPRYYAFLNAGLHDWARLGELIRLKGKWNGKQVLPARWIAAITAPSAGNPGYGMGMWRGSPYVQERRYSKESPTTIRQEKPFLADDVVYFDGFGGQRVYAVPSAGLVIARAGAPGPGWDEGVLVNLALKGLKR